MADTGFAAVADRAGAGEGRQSGGLHERQGVPGIDLHTVVRRPYAEPRSPLVQHGDLRQPREAGGSPKPRQGTTLRSATSARAPLIP